jgi:hypothetical protein
MGDVVDVVVVPSRVGVGEEGRIGMKNSFMCNNTAVELETVLWRRNKSKKRSAWGGIAIARGG